LFEFDENSLPQEIEEDVGEPSTSDIDQKWQWCQEVGKFE
jgi:hypothetical protein